LPRLRPSAREGEYHDPRAQAGNDRWMRNWRGFIFAEIAPHPGDTLTAHNVIGIDQFFDPRNGRDMPSDHNFGMGRKSPNHPAHLANLAHIDDDRRNSHDVVLMAGQFASKVILGREVENRAGGGDVRLNEHDAPRTVKHSQGEAALCAGDLIVIKLHRIDGAAAELVILRIWPED